MRVLRRLSLRHQQLLFFAVVTALVLVIMGVGISVSARYTETFGESLNRYLRIHDLRSALSTAHSHLSHYVRRSDPADRQVLEDQEARIEAIWAAIGGLEIDDRASRFELVATYYGLLAYRSAAYRAMAEYEADDGRYAFTIAYADRVYGYVDSYLERLLSIQLDAGRYEYEAAIDRQHQIRTFALSAIVLVGVALAVFATLFARSVTIPLERITADAHALAAGDFDRAALELPESADLHDVALAFNTMSASIRGLVNDLRDKHELQQRLHEQEISNIQMERLLRESQLVALQSQMNPHFLFNTLNTIARTAHAESAGRSERSIRGLAAVLRYLLHSPTHSVSLREELRVVSDYLELQQVRFGRRLRYRVEVDPGAEEAQIPPLVIQPIVENAVIYGVEPLEDGATVTVAARRSGGRILLTVSDDGAGMDREHLAALLSAEAEAESIGERVQGIGLRNVRKRLSLYSGDEMAFSIRSAVGEGTVVEIELPLRSAPAVYGVTVGELHDSHR